jgi:putative PIN family toxin of toxin-antitoxin system
MSSVRYVFDTNTLISALLFEHSTPGRALLRALRLGEILLSQATMEELAEVLQREKFDRYVTTAQREEFLEAIVMRANFIEATEVVRVCRDTRDDKFLELAISGKANYIISGDKDLLSLHPFGDVSVVTPTEFLAATEGADEE